MTGNKENQQTYRSIHSKSFARHNPFSALLSHTNLQRTPPTMGSTLVPNTRCKTVNEVYIITATTKACSGCEKLLF